MSDFMPMLHDETYLDLVDYVEDIIGKGNLVKEGGEQVKIKNDARIIGLVKKKH